MSSAKSLGHLRTLEESLKKQSMKQRLNPSFAKNFLWNLFFPTTQWALDAPSPRIQEEVSSAKRFCIRFCAKMGCSVFYSYHYNQTYRTYIKCSIYSIGKDLYIYIYHLWHQNFKNIIPLLKTNHAYWGKMRTYKPFYEFTIIHPTFWIDNFWRTPGCCDIVRG